jgi:acetyltransferase-like isoleucine patch superfamily enzyme
MVASKAMRAWRLARSRLLWSWRFQSLGARSSVGKCRYVSYPGSICIGHHTSICDNWTLADLAPGRNSEPKIRIGNYCTILHDFQCNASVSVEIGDYVLIAPRVFVTDSDHIVDEGGERTSVGRQFNCAPVVIEHDCWLGVNAVILKGVRIGHHAVVAANAVVTRDVPPGSKVAGVPARVIASTTPGALSDLNSNHVGRKV